MEILQIPRPLVNQILTHAQHSPEAEVCGLLGGRDGLVMSCYPVENEAGEPLRRYQMSAKEQVDAMRRMREAGEELIAIYHSHPCAPAEPSAIDIEEASYPEAAYLIVSLNTEGVLQLSAFEIKSGQATQVAVELC